MPSPMKAIALFTALAFSLSASATPCWMKISLRSAFLTTTVICLGLTGLRCELERQEYSQALSTFPSSMPEAKTDVGSLTPAQFQKFKQDRKSVLRFAYSAWGAKNKDIEILDLATLLWERAPTSPSWDKKIKALRIGPREVVDMDPKQRAKVLGPLLADVLIDELDSMQKSSPRSQPYTLDTALQELRFRGGVIRGKKMPASSMEECYRKARGTRMLWESSDGWLDIEGEELVPYTTDNVALMGFVSTYIAGDTTKAQALLGAVGVSPKLPNYPQYLESLMMDNDATSRKVPMIDKRAFAFGVDLQVRISMREGKTIRQVLDEMVENGKARLQNPQSP